ncbi:MAG: polyphosphate kinase 1 [Chloroflexota bacterium]
MSDQKSDALTTHQSQEMPIVENSVELGPNNYINRELSTIDFNRRVLALAQEPSIPLLERIKFVAIVGNNLDEFYMVRVASYVQKYKLGINSARPDGYTPSMLMAGIRERVMRLMIEQRTTMRVLLEELEQNGIFIRRVNDLSPEQQDALRAYFHEEVFPVLTPLAADHARPFPFISNLSLNLGVYLRRSNTNANTDFVRIKVPEALPRLVYLNRHVSKYLDGHVDGDVFVWIEDAIAQNLDLLFPGMEIMEQYPFRVTRNADIDYEHEKEEELLDISAVIEASVRERRFGSVVRLSVPSDISPNMLNRLIHELNVDPDRDVYSIDGALGSSSLFELAAIDRPDLKYPPHVPRVPEELPQATDIFAAIRENDVLVHHPYDSFIPVEEFFRQASKDPAVLAIKATLYRVGKDSPVVRSLMEARENDKQVAVLVELKARFDEENNLGWARQMEQQGVHVTYGVEKLPVKTHAKIAMVVRKEADGLRRYVHLGTGNYNSGTARLYSDLGLFTADPEIGEDATKLFNRLTGYAPETNYKRLLVAPEYLLDTLLSLIDQEIRVAQEGGDARLVFKMNQLEEDVMIQKLYQASNAGVRIDLIVRGLCCLKAGMPGMSEHIRVRSILGRFLEHPRIYYFKNAPEDQQLYAGSADLMRRNLYNRVETVYPILDPRLRRKALRILATDLRCNTLAWEMQPDGSYARVQPGPDEPLIDSQYIFMQDSAGLDIPLD